MVVPTNDLHWEGGEENASEKKIYAIYKMMCSELIFRAIMEVERDRLNVKHQGHELLN